MRFLLFVLAVASLPSGHHFAQWTSNSPQNGAVVYACVGGTVALPWNYILSSHDVLGDTQWYYDGNSQELVAVSSHGQFLPLPAFANRVQFVDNAGITVSQLNVADSGNYSVEIHVYGDSGIHTVLRRSAVVQVSDQLMTQDGRLHVTQRPSPVLDTTTNEWAIQLQCGVFAFRGDLPYSAEWITPAGNLVNSSDFSDKHFNLLLTSPVQGGNYTCRVLPRPTSDVCIHGNSAGHVQTSISVDKVGAQLILLLKENEQLKEELKQLKQSHLSLSQVQSQEQVKVTHLQDRMDRLDERTQLQIAFHAIDLLSQTPPVQTPMIVNLLYYNQGNAYNETTGYFTVPVPGLYFFFANTRAYASTGYPPFFLYADDGIVSVPTIPDDKRLLVIAHSITRLSKGQRVWMRSSGFQYAGDETAFSGFLVSVDP